MTTPDKSHIFRDVVVGVLVLVVGAAILAFASVPTRLAVVEADHASLKETVNRMDGKLDKVLERLTRR